MPSPYDPRADNIPNWIWQNQRALGASEIIPTSDVDEIELEVRSFSEYFYRYLSIVPDTKKILATASSL